MGGFTFCSSSGPIPWTTVGRDQRRLLLQALTKAQVKWEVVGESCPDCILARVSRQSVVQALEEARLFACRTPEFLRADPFRWKGGSTSREVFFELVKVLLEELSRINEDSIRIEEEFLVCEHPKLSLPKRRQRRKKNETLR